MDLTLHLTGKNDSFSTLRNQTETDIFCTIYQAAAECKCEKEVYANGWFFILIALIGIIVGVTFVLRSLQEMSLLRERLSNEANRRQQPFHMH